MPANVPEGGIWLATRPADMRKSFDGLAAPVRNELGGDVVSGGWFVFADRRRTMMKIIGFGPGGCWIRAGGSSRVCSRPPSALSECVKDVMASILAVRSRLRPGRSYERVSRKPIKKWSRKRSRSTGKVPKDRAAAEA
ncbi:MAG: IS66 family insertion sequence element accessory protein TnpB [Albidovulum sp.]|nr:IS66 family insertion sequence element accessory protein TnpB [Albidovulum sp.]